jgi:hypothetical protein
MRKETPLLQNTSKAKKKSIITMTEIHTFRCDRYSREAFINHAWGTQERSLLESRQRTLLPWAFVLFIKRTALSRPRWTTGRMGQTGQIPGWPPVSFWCHSNSLSLLSGITVSAKLANSLCVSGYRLCNRGYCLCIRTVSAISADSLRPLDLHTSGLLSLY